MHRVAWLAMLVLVLVVPGRLAAQLARVAGTVRTQRGAPLAGARVRVEGGGATESDARGAWALELEAGAPRVLLLAAIGHEPERVPLPALTPGARHVVAVTLRPLVALDALTVVARRERPLLDTEGAGTGGALEAAEVEALPVDAREPLALAWNVPGIAQAQAFFGDAPLLSVNGGNALSTQHTLDGLDNNEGFLGGPRVELPLGALERLDARVNSYSAEWGRSPTGIIDQQSRAGGLRRQGDLFAYWRPGRPLDARLPVPFGGVPEAIARRQDGFQRLQVGGALAGPLARDRTFGSAAAELTREDEDRIGSTALAPFLGTEARRKLKLFGRIDHGWSATQVTTLRVAASATDRAGEGNGVITPEADLTTRRIGTLAALTHRSTLRGGRAGNTVSAQLGTFAWSFPPTASDFTRPQVTVVTPGLATQAVVGSSNFVFDERETQLQLRDVFETQLGRRHTLRAGADVVTAWFRLGAAGTNPNGSYVVVNDGDIPAPAGRPLTFADIPATARVLSYTMDASPQQVDLTQTVAGAFVEDRWRVSPSLLLVAGVRWDFDDLTTRGDSRADLDNVQPRLSFNWLRRPTHVVRGGIGLYAGKLPYAIYSDAVQLGANGNAVVTFAGADAPAYLQGPTPAQLRQRRDQLPPREVFQLFARGIGQPVSRQATLGTQLQLGRDWAVAVDAIWMETRGLPRLLDLNPSSRRIGPGDVTDQPCASAFSCPADASRPVAPVAGGARRISTAESGGRARYRALYVQARRQLSRSWTVDANWTWSHAENDTEDINFSAAVANCFARERVDAVTGQACTTDEWADANNDRRHRVTVRAVHTWRDRVRVALIGDVQSGLPANRLAGVATPQGNAVYDLLGVGPVRGNGFIGNANRLAGVPRNGERLPGYANVSVSVAWLAPVGGQDLELRADAFNLLNTVHWGGFPNGLGGGGTRTQYGRPGDPILLFTPGPPRQVQLSARWLF
ncbi:MAG: TonB-dependent receptor [Gemmatimonadales bacterium]|nr:TonB-dependent receptor [Gemmatimonadales bacterium]